MRRLLFLLAGVVLGAGFLILVSAGTRAARGAGFVLCAVLVAGCAIGGRWGHGPVARGVRAPGLARAGSAMLVMSACATALWLWRPSVAAPLPVGPFLVCAAAGGLLLIPVGLMGRDER